MNKESITFIIFGIVMVFSVVYSLHKIDIMEAKNNKSRYSAWCKITKNKNRLTLEEYLNRP